METFSALLAFYAGNSPVTGEFPAERPVTLSFDVFFDLRPDEQLSKHWRRRGFEKPSQSLWRRCNNFVIGDGIFNGSVCSQIWVAIRSTKLNTTAHWEMSIINMITLHAKLWSITDYKLQQYCKIYAIEVFGSFQFKDPVLLYE